MHKEQVIIRRRPLYGCHSEKDRAILIKALEVFRELQTPTVRTEVERIMIQVRQG